MESPEREQGTPQEQLGGDQPAPDQRESDDMGYDSPEDSSRQDEEEMS